MITGKNFIGNELIGNGKVTFKTYDPVLNKENEWTFIEVSDDELQRAVQLANVAFEVYRNVSGDQRAVFLEQIADEIETLGGELLNVFSKESGLPTERARVERSRTTGQLRKFAELLKEGSWVDARINTSTDASTPDLRKLNIPIGPIVVFGASNFPLAYSTAGGDTASALAAGCPVIVKSHPMHAGTGEMVASAVVKAAKKTNMPNGVFSNLNSSGIDVGVKLVSHPYVKGVGFTGSINGGRALMDLAAKRDEPIPVFAEMGSINPVVLLPKYLQENLSEVVEMYANSITQGAGQFCTNPGLLLGLKSDLIDQFAIQLGQEVASKEPVCMLHPTIHNNFEKGKKNALNENASVVAKYEGQSNSNCGEALIATVSGAEFLQNTKLHHEVFGPFSMIVKCESISQLEEIIAKLEGQLTGTILATEDELISNNSVVDKLRNRVGRMIWNGVPTGVQVNPSMMHGGPYPASSDVRYTAVGVDGIKRWVRPAAFQNWPDQLLPIELQNENALGILRMVNGEFSRKSIN